MKIEELRKCKENALNISKQTIKDFNEAKVFDMRTKKVIYSTEEKVSIFIWARCINLNGRINAKNFNQVARFLIEWVEII